MAGYNRGRSGNIVPVQSGLGDGILSGFNAGGVLASRGGVTPNTFASGRAVASGAGQFPGGVLPGVGIGLGLNQGRGVGSNYSGRFNNGGIYGGNYLASAGRVIPTAAGAGDGRQTSWPSGVLASRGGTNLTTPVSFANGAIAGAAGQFQPGLSPVLPRFPLTNVNIGNIGAARRLYANDPRQYIDYSLGADPRFYPRYIDPNSERYTYPRVYPGTNFNNLHLLDVPYYGSQYYYPPIDPNYPIYNTSGLDYLPDYVPPYSDGPCRASYGDCAYKYGYGTDDCRACAINRGASPGCVDRVCGYPYL